MLTFYLQLSFDFLFGMCVILCSAAAALYLLRHILFEILYVDFQSKEIGKKNKK